MHSSNKQWNSKFRLPEPESHPDVDNASPGHSSINENDIPDAKSSHGLDAGMFISWINVPTHGLV